MGRFIGTAGDDTITTGFVSTDVTAEPAGTRPSAQDDSIHGDAGDDVLSGGAGNDIIDGGTGSDTIRGGPGDDVILGKTPGVDDENDRDTIYGDAGNDVIYGNGGETDGYSLDGADRIFGGAGDDGLFGKRGDDFLYGGSGNDKLGGYYGADQLYGQDGDDRLIGRHDADRLSGGAGNDIYEYVAVTDSTASARDLIVNFDGVGAGPGDRISLLRIDADPLTDGDQAFVFAGVNEIAGRGEVSVNASGAFTVIRANIDDSPASELEILVKDGSAQPDDWVAGDFLL